MGLIKRLFDASQGLALMMRYTRIFDRSLLDGKRVAIVGPANSAYGAGKGEYIDQFDFVIRINRAPWVLKENQHRSDLGIKTDILFHSFFENDFSGGGALDFDLYDRLGIRYVVNPIPTFFGKRVIFNFYKKYLLKRTVFTLPRGPYKEILKKFGRFRPTTGFCALHMALESHCSELFITGFTFFRTPYGDGYRDALKDVDVNKKYIKDSDIHNPEIEYENFKAMLKAQAGKRILTDKVLKAILESDGVNLIVA